MAHTKLAKKRIEFFKRWQVRAKDIDKQEDAFIGQAPEHAQRILCGKRLQLWNEILKDLGYVDSNLITDIANGFDLIGWLRKSGVFAVGVRRPAFSRDTLLKLAKGLNQATLNAMERRQEQHLEEGTWTETVDELSKGWYMGCHGWIIGRQSHCETLWITTRCKVESNWWLLWGLEPFGGPCWEIPTAFYRPTCVHRFPQFLRGVRSATS